MKKILAILLALTLTVALAACGDSGSGDTAPAPADGGGDTAPADGGGGDSGSDFDPSQYSVAIAMDSMNHPVHRIVQLGLLQAAAELGYTNAKVIGTEGGDTTEVFAAAEAFAAEGGNGLLLWAGDSSSYETVASLGSQGVVVGIPHFSHLQDDGSYPEGLAFNMACNPVAYGKEVAEFMADRLSGQTGTIALTQNTKNNTENAATDSFVETWNSLVDSKDLGGITVLPVELEGGVIDQATAVNLAIIQSNADLIGAFGTTGNSPITWADAANKAGYEDGQLLIVGMDATEANLAYLDEGKVAAIVAQPLYEEAYKTMEYLDTIFRGGTVPQWTDLDAPLVTKDGTGPNSIQYHLDIAAEVATFFQ